MSKEERLKRIKRKRELEKQVEKLVNMIKKEDVYLKKCKEYDKDPDFIDNVEIEFDDGLDVSGKTVNGHIFLNGALFDDGDVEDQLRYVLHELVHVMQQRSGMVSGKAKNKSYLDDENEQEAFKAQLQYMDDNYTEEEVQDYLEGLLDHHNIEGKERREKIRILTEDMED